jgi:hypothetical protein
VTGDDAAPERLAESGAALVAGIRTHLPGWLTDRAVVVLDAWGGAAAVLDARGALEQAGRAATERVAGAVDDLARRPPGAHRTTPLELLRSAHREPTAVLARLGVGAVVRDPFDERFAPDDVYDLSPKGFADLGGAELGAHLLRWGIVKARLLRPPTDPD